MSDPCEIVEVAAVATSSFPVLEEIVVCVSNAEADSEALLGLSELAADSGVATSAVDLDAYATLSDAATAGSTLILTNAVTAVLDSAARARSQAFVVEMVVATSSAAAASVVETDTPVLVEDGAVVSDTVIIDRTSEVILESTAAGQTSLVIGHAELAAESAAALSAATPYRSAAETVESAAVGLSIVLPAAVVAQALLSSDAGAASSTTLVTDTSVLGVSDAVAESGIWARNPELIAWTLNTETLGSAWYTNFDFQSVAQADSKVFAVTEDGLYELTGDTDEGVPIAAQVQYGFMDFGTPYQKRIDGVYVGYSAAGAGLQLLAETREGGAQTHPMVLYDTTDNAPRNTRVKPGKGMLGRYWRLTFENIAGASFTVHDIQADIAVSSRRVG